MKALADRKNGMLWMAVLCILALLTGPALAAMDPRDPRDINAKARKVEEAKKRWNKTSRAQRSKLLKKYKHYKSLPDHEKKRLRELHKKLEAMREGLRDEETASSETAGGENKEKLQKKIRTHLEKCERESKKQTRMSGDPRKQRSAMIRELCKHLENLNADRIIDFLRKMHREGVITREKMDEIKVLPHSEIKAQIFEIGQKRLMEDMGDLVEPQEKAELEELEPWSFHRRMRHDQEKWGMIRPLFRLATPTPEQEKELAALPEGEEKEKARHAIHQANLRAHLEEAGVKSADLDHFFSLPRQEQQRYIMKELGSIMKKGPPYPPALERIKEKLGPGRRHGSRPEGRDAHSGPGHRGQRRRGLDRNDGPDGEGKPPRDHEPPRNS